MPVHIDLTAMTLSTAPMSLFVSLITPRIFIMVVMKYVPHVIVDKVAFENFFARKKIKNVGMIPPIIAPIKYIINLPFVL
jgi:hypothetical protein